MRSLAPGGTPSTAWVRAGVPVLPQRRVRSTSVAPRPLDPYPYDGRLTNAWPRPRHEHAESAGLRDLPRVLQTNAEVGRRLGFGGSTDDTLAEPRSTVFRKEVLTCSA
jgi:hypothetical protein